MFMTRIKWRLFGSLNKKDNGMDKKDEMSISGSNL